MPQQRYATMEEIARCYGVTRQMVAKWEDQGAPTSGAKYLAEWLLDRQRLKPSVQAEAERVAGRRMHSRKPGVAHEVNQQAADIASEIQASFRNAATGKSPKGDIAESNTQLAQFRDHAAAQLASAVAADDRAEIVYWGKEYRAYEEVCQKGLLLAKKLGIDNGELLKRADAEQYLRGIAYWLVRGIDTAKRRLREHISAPNPDLVLDANLLPNALVGPMARAVRIDGPVSLPDWAVDCITDAIDDYIENGAEEVNAVLAEEAQTDAP